MSIDLSAEKNAWKALEPYAQLVMWLMPRSDAVRVFDSQGWLRWSSASTTGPDLPSAVQELKAEALQDPALAGRALQLEGEELPTYFWWLRDDQGHFLATVAISVRKPAQADQGGFEFVDTLVHPAMECLRRELAGRSALLNLHHSLSARDKDVEMLLSVADQGIREAGETADELKTLLQNAVEHLGGVLATLVIPDKNIAMMRTGNGQVPDSALVARTHQQLMQLMQTRREAVAINRLVSKGEQLPYRILCGPVKNPAGRVTGLLALFREIEGPEFLDRDGGMLELLARKVGASVDASFDSLSGLLTSQSLERRARAALAVPGDTRDWSLLYVDCDELHRINEEHGMPAGDEVLARVAEFLRRRLPPDGIAARISGDRFAIVLPMKHEDASGMAEVLRQGVCQLGIMYGSARLPVTVTLGVAQLESGADPLAHAMAVAEAACRTGKERGRNRIEVYRNADLNIIRRATDITSADDLREVIQSGRLRLDAQPMQAVAPGSAGSLPHFEILLRMTGTRGETVGPDRFLGTVQRYRLMPLVDRWVVEQAIVQLKPFAAALLERDVSVSVNLSGQSLHDEGFADFLVSRVEGCGFDPALLRFEIAEGDAVSNVAQAELLMRRMRKLGCGVALDDFGTGLSSLSYLRSLPVTMLKIDGSFTRDILTDPRAESMVKAIAQLARTLSITTVAECVETDQIRAHLGSLGVDFAQGFSVGRPAPLDRLLEEVVRRPKPQRAPAAAPDAATAAASAAAPAAVAPAPAPAIVPAPLAEPPVLMPRVQAAPEPQLAPPVEAAIAAEPAARPPRQERKLDRAALNAAGLLSLEHQHQLAAQFRRIKRPIIAGAFGRTGQGLTHGNIVMVASAVPGEGKSFTSLNLALSIAREKDVNVVLVDADVAKRHLSEMLGLKGERGLIDVVSEDSNDLEDVLVRTEFPSLSVLPAGRLSDHATELLSSARMQQAITELGSRLPNRIVIMDSPPVLLTTEARALAEIAGQIILVVRAGVTPHAVLADAIAQLPGKHSISLVLNQSTAAASSSYYYGYGEKHGQPAA
jgi:exopolysaccharide/PEP-CTERM locus tyrosine autokinase